MLSNTSVSSLGGPGTYNPADMAPTQVYTFGAKREDKNRDPSPGPGTYRDQNAVTSARSPATVI